MDFLPRELIAQLELYQHSFHETILCLLGTSHSTEHHTSLTRPHITLYLTLHLKSGWLYVTSNKYVAATRSWPELLSHEPARPARRYLPLLPPGRPALLHVQTSFT